MSFDAMLKELNANLRDLNVNLAALNNANTKAAPAKETAPKAEPVATGAAPATPVLAPAPAVTAPAASTVSTLTFDDIKVPFLALVKSNRDAAVKVLKDAGVPEGGKLSAVKPEQYADVLAAINAAGATSGALV